MILKKYLGADGYKILKLGITRDHPIFAVGLGICSALAVSNTVANAIAMGAGVTFVLIATAVIISSLRSLIPQRARIITYMITIASFVIIVQMFLDAFSPTISEALGPYVALIITNCIIMGRAEAFYVTNGVRFSVIDAVSNGIAYTYTLVAIAVVREILGFGTLLGFQVTPDGWPKWVVMSMAPGAFFLLGVAIWISKTITEGGSEEEEE
ncbi:MAG: NADH:ubiquinone reductase (Na(+)-transporting) subunit D [Planctomycetota bacterium]|nr:MAG: NADH:ubiquinone reductase (Na(+)-transporting) subunit D [Planctomycetota bacterium]